VAVNGAGARRRWRNISYNLPSFDVSSGQMAITERIGEFLVKIGAITPSQAQAVLKVQELGDKRRFGEIALALGYLSDDALRRYVDYLEKQKHI